MAAPYRSLAELASNGRRNILVVAGHQDDEVIGMGGTIKLLSQGVTYLDSGRSSDTKESPFTSGSLQWLPKSVVVSIKEEFSRRGVELNLLPEEPSNVVVLYLTSGAKTEDTVSNDLAAAYPGFRVDRKKDKGWLTDLTDALNTCRYPEALRGLGYVGAKAAIFLDHPSRQIKPNSIGNQQATADLQAIIEIVKPETIYTHSPFDRTHDTHIITSAITVEAVRSQQTEQYGPKLKGYPVWDPVSAFHKELVDISEVLEDKLSAISQHSFLGSQRVLGRLYEKVLGLNQIFAERLILSTNSFNAVMQRPRLPAGVLAVEMFVDMGLLLAQRNMNIRDFVSQHYAKQLADYPNC